MIQYTNIKSQLDALKLKDIEYDFYNIVLKDIKVIPKVTPFKGINIDILCVHEDKLLFVKFVETTEDLFSILEEELIEVMDEEFSVLRNNMMSTHEGINYNYVFVMPYVEIDNFFGYEEFIKRNVIDRDKLERILNDEESILTYFSEANEEVNLNLFLFDICKEYYLINNTLHMNNEFKKITFYYNDGYEYTATMMKNSQITNTSSIVYGNSLIRGGSGTGKTTLIFSRAIKLSKIYPHHRFIIFTHNKQSCSELREIMDISYKESENLEIHTFGSFIFKLVKMYGLIINYSMLKSDYEKTFKNLVKQADNIIKNKNMFKGIFLDEAECFLDEDIEFIRKFLYKSKYIFNLSSCSSLNIFNTVNVFKNQYSYIDFDVETNLNDNYRQTREITEYINKFSDNVCKFMKNINANIKRDIIYKTNSTVDLDGSVDIIKVIDLDDQINSVIWEIEYLTTKLGIKYDEIAILYPYNKKKLKNGNTIYFQYMLKKALEASEIPYIFADENITNISFKTGVTLSNIYTIKSLEYKVLIVCELEMLYNQTINSKDQDYQINDFIGDLNKIYLAFSRATRFLKIVTTFDEDGSDLIKLIVESI